MPLTIAQKMKIKEGMKILSINAPKDFEKHLSPIPARVSVSETSRDYNQIHWFVKDKAQMEKELGKVFKLLKGEVLCWIYYPKGSSKIQTDLTRDKGWDALMTHKNIQWITLVSFDDTWSAFAIRLKTETDKKKEAKAPERRAIFDYADSATKTIRLPDDLKDSLKKSKKALVYFETLSFSNKREYIEWIITAKREETRNERVNGTIERLEKSWKNPRNI